MAQLTSDEANQLSNNFLGLAQAVGDYRFQNWNSLTKEENEQLSSFQWSLLNNGEDILTFSTTLIMDEVSDTLNAIQSLTNNINQTLHKLQNIQKVINIAGSAVTLGAAIIGKDPKAIAAAIAGLVQTAKS